MTDQPYGLDLFHKITDVHFGGQWFFVWGPSSAPGHTSGSFEIDFPDQSGGTPGLIPRLSGPPAVFAPYLPIVAGAIKSSDLTQGLKTNAGAKVTAFGYKQYINVDAALLFFRLGSGFPSSPFRVRTTVSSIGTASNYFVSVGTLQKNFIKAGTVISFDPFDPGPPVLSSARGSFTTAGPRDFLVNPSTLKVTGPF